MLRCCRVEPSRRKKGTGRRGGKGARSAATRTLAGAAGCAMRREVDGSSGSAAHRCHRGRAGMRTWGPAKRLAPARKSAVRTGAAITSARAPRESPPRGAAARLTGRPAPGRPRERRRPRSGEPVKPARGRGRPACRAWLFMPGAQGAARRLDEIQRRRRRRRGGRDDPKRDRINRASGLTSTHHVATRRPAS